MRVIRSILIILLALADALPGRRAGPGNGPGRGSKFGAVRLPACRIGCQSGRHPPYFPLIGGVND